MDDCRRTAGRVTPFLDGALPASEQAEVEQHLNACPPCRQGANQEQAGRTVLRECADRLKAQPLPPGLRSRCESLAREHARVRQVAWWRMLLPATGIAVVLMFVAVLVFSVATRRSDVVLAAQLTADHVKCFKMFDPGGAQPIDAEHVERDLEASYGWDMHIPPSSDDLALLGGRRCLYADGTVPHVMYRTKASEPISLFRLDNATRASSDVTSLGHRSRIWSRDGHTYVLVMPRDDTPEMARLARYIEAVAR